MTCYRLYFMDRGGHIHRFQEFDAVDDHDALPKAALLRSQSGMELWTDSRRVRRWEARSPREVQSKLPRTARR